MLQNKQDSATKTAIITCFCWGMISCGSSSDNSSDSSTPVINPTNSRQVQLSSSAYVDDGTFYNGNGMAIQLNQESTGNNTERSEYYYSFTAPASEFVSVIVDGGDIDHDLTISSSNFYTDATSYSPRELIMLETVAGTTYEIKILANHSVGEASNYTLTLAQADRTILGVADTEYLAHANFIESQSCTNSNGVTTDEDDDYSEYLVVDFSLGGIRPLHIEEEPGYSYTIHQDYTVSKAGLSGTTTINDEFVLHERKDTNALENTISATLTENNNKATYTLDFNLNSKQYENGQLVWEETCTGTATGTMEFIL